MRRVLFFGIFFVIILIGWGLSSLLSKPVEINLPTPPEKVGIFSKNVILRGREEGNISWEISSDALEVDLQYKHFSFSGNIEGKIFRENKLSINVKGNKAEIDTEKGILVFPYGVSFTTEDGYKGFSPYGEWNMNTKEFICSRGRVRFEKVGEFKAEANYFRFSVDEGVATFEGDVIIETGI